MKPKLRLVRNETMAAEEAPRFTWLPLWKDRTALMFLSAWALMLVLFSPARVMDFDVAIRAAVAKSLWTQGSVFVERGSPVDSGLVWVTPETGTSFYGIGQSLAFIPFDIAGTLAGMMASTASGAQSIQQTTLALFYVPLVGTLWFYTLWIFLQAWGLGRKDSVLATIAYFLASPALYYSTQSAQEEALVATLGLAALTFARIGSDVTFRDARSLFLCGLFAGLAVLVRMNAVFFMLPIFGIIWDAYRANPKAFKENLPFTRYAGMGAAIPLSLFCLFAMARFGSPIALGYDQARHFGLGVFWTSFQPDIAIGFLFGLGKGLFILCPALFLAFWGMRTTFQQHKGFGYSIVVAFALSCLFHGHIANNPDGSECWSVRYLMHLTTLLVLPAWAGFQRAKAHEPWKAISYSMLAVGVFFALLSLMAPNSLEYTQNASEGKPQKTLLLSWFDGQLARRATNVSLKLSGESIEDTVSNATEKQSVAAYASQYVPNIWPWVLSRKFPQHTLWVWLAWLGCLAMSVHLFWRVIPPKRPTRPDIRPV